MMCELNLSQISLPWETHANYCKVCTLKFYLYWSCGILKIISISTIEFSINWSGFITSKRSSLLTSVLIYFSLIMDQMFSIGLLFLGDRHYIILMLSDKMCKSQLFNLKLLVCYVCHSNLSSQRIYKCSVYLLSSILNQNSHFHLGWLFPFRHPLNFIPIPLWYLIKY